MSSSRGRTLDGRRPAPRPRTGPVAAATRTRLDVERVVAGGDGLAREASGRVVFVPGALPGEVVDAQLVDERRDFARGRLDAVVVAEPRRVVPPCPFLHRGCGGCDWQHATAELQMQLKVGIVREALERTGKLVDPMVVAGGAVDPWAYRTTMRFAVAQDGRLALHRPRSTEVVPLDDCLVAHPQLADLLRTVRVTGADEVVARVGDATGKRAMWWTPATAAADGLPDDVLVGDAAAIDEEVDGVRLRVSAGSFFQSGPAAAQLLVDAVRAAAGDALRADARVVDAYGGIGLFAGTVARGCASVVVVEGSTSAVADARENLADRISDGTAQVVCAAVEDWTPVGADLVIADPSRRGLGAAAVDVLAATGAPVLVLISCDPVALARDVGLLAAHGFRPGPTTVLDLFPQTHHVEAVTRFERS